MRASGRSHPVGRLPSIVTSSFPFGKGRLTVANDAAMRKERARLARFGYKPARTCIPKELQRLPVWLLFGDGKCPLYADGSPRRDELESPADRERLVSFDEAAALLTRVRITRGFGCGTLKVSQHEHRCLRRRCGHSVRHRYR
jgi:hypothetical protein